MMAQSGLGGGDVLFSESATAGYSYFRAGTNQPNVVPPYA